MARAYRGGIVLDCNDVTSGQSDVVIYSQWSPILRQQRKPIFLAEGTYAVIEVKSLLTTSNLRDAIVASAHLKSLRTFLLPEESGIIGFSATANSICTGVFAYRSRIKPERVRDVLIDMHASGLENGQMPDFVCVNGQYYFHRFRNEDVSAYAAMGGGAKSKSLDEVRRECRYHCSPSAFGMMFSTILSYVSYLGPIQHWFDSYLHVHT